jgi:ribosome-binding protein aMBF1 (putative translation factor)
MSERVCEICGRVPARFVVNDDGRDINVCWEDAGYDSDPDETSPGYATTVPKEEQK